MTEYEITIRLSTDMERGLVEALTESMIDDSMFAMREAELVGIAMVDE